MSNSFASRVKQRREQLGLNNSELARLVNVTPQASRLWEMSEGPSVSADTLLKLADVFGVSPKELLYGSEVPITSHPMNNVKISSQRLVAAMAKVDKSLGKSYESLPLEKKGRLISFLYNNNLEISDQEVRALLELFE